MKSKNKNEIRLLFMIILSLGGQIVSLYKSIYTAQFYGTSDAIDAYNYATNLATFFFDFIASGVSTVILPAYIRKASNKSINAFISLIYGVVSLILIGVYLVRRPLIQMLTNRGEIFINSFCDYVLIVFLIQACTSIVLVLSSFFQSKDMYVIPKIVLFASNILVLLLLLLVGETSIDIYFKIVFVGAFSNLVINYILAIKEGFSFVPSLHIFNRETYKLIELFVPTLLSCGVFKIHTLIDTMIVTNVGAGMLTILTYSSQVSGMISNFVISNMLTIAYPQIVRGAQLENKQKQLWKYIILFHAIICLLVCGFMTVGENGINLLYVKGEFTAENGYGLYMGALIYLAAQIFLIIRDLIFRFFYAMENIKDTVTNSMVSCVFNIIMSLILTKPLGMYGVILGTLISGVISLLMILYRMKKLYGLEEFWSNLFEIIKNTLVLIATAFLVVIAKQYIIVRNDIVAILVYGILTVIVFVSFSFIFNLKALKIRM